MNVEDKAKWGILGTAKIAKQALVPGIRGAEGSELYAVASRDPEKADRFAAEIGAPKSHGSYESLLEDPEVEFVYVPLPNHLHLEWARKAARGGKNVLCEKPLGADPDEVKQTFAVAETEGVTLMEGFMYRFHPQVRRVKAFLNEGKIGEPRYFRGSFSFPLVAEDRSDDIRWKEEMDGGSLMDLGTYSVNTVRYLFGEEPVRVTARERKHPDHTAEAETQAILEFPGGKSATIDSSFLLDDRASYEISSENGRIRAYDTYAPGLGKDSIIEIQKRNCLEQETIKGVNEYALEVEGLVEAARADEEPLVSPEDSVNNARVLAAIRESAEKGEWVEL